MNELYKYNRIIVEWIEFRETHEYSWIEKRGNKVVMGSIGKGILKEIKLDEE